MVQRCPSKPRGAELSLELYAGYLMGTEKAKVGLKEAEHREKQSWEIVLDGL